MSDDNNFLQAIHFGLVSRVNKQFVCEEGKC